MKLDPFKKISVSLLLLDPPPVFPAPPSLSAVGFSPTPPSSLPPYSSLLWHLFLLLLLFSTFSLNPGIGRRPLLQSRSVQMSWLVFFLHANSHRGGRMDRSEFCKAWHGLQRKRTCGITTCNYLARPFCPPGPRLDSSQKFPPPRGDAQKRRLPPLIHGRLCRLGWFGEWRRDGSLTVGA